MNYGLPTQENIQGTEYEIRADYRAVLDICTALSDPELSDREKALCALDIFYPAFEDMPPEHYEDALTACFRFINCGDEDQGKKGPKLVDWEQDFRYVVAPINKALGKDIRSIPYDFESNTGGLHWWTFISLYMEIGDCVFAQIVSIRDKLSRGKPLDKQEKAWYRQNRSLVDFKRRYTAADDELLKQWAGK